MNRRTPGVGRVIDSMGKQSPVCRQESNSGMTFKRLDRDSHEYQGNILKRDAGFSSYRFFVIPYGVSWGVTTAGVERGTLRVLGFKCAALRV